MSPNGEYRFGIGYDSHRFAEGGPVRLGGIDIPADVHCEAHSDGDAVLHALTDAILGAAGLDDIGEMFPDTAGEDEGRDSTAMLRAAIARVESVGWKVNNVDVTVVTQKPKLSPFRAAIKASIASSLGIQTDGVGIKGKTNERMGWIGREEGLGVIAVASLVRRDSEAV